MLIIHVLNLGKDASLPCTVLQHFDTVLNKVNV